MVMLARMTVEGLRPSWLTWAYVNQQIRLIAINGRFPVMYSHHKSRR
jgi:hypothetical protein